MVQQLLPGGHVPFMPQVEEEKKPQFITELEINDFPQHARWKVRLHHSLNHSTKGHEDWGPRLWLWAQSSGYTVLQKSRRF